MEEDATSPILPSLPLDDLSLTDSFNASSVWSTTTNTTTINSESAPSSPSYPSSSTYHSPNKEGFNLNDLDPYAPSPFIDSNSLGLRSNKPLPPPLERIATATLGSSVLPHSRLELIDASPEHSPTSPAPPLPPVKEASPPFTPPKNAPRLSNVSEAGGSGLFSLFRGSSSSSGVSAAKGKSTGAEEEKAGLRQDYSEKSQHSQHQRTPSDSVNPTPIASTSSISNPLTTFASAFRSATSSRTSSQAGTPPPKPSSEKTGYLDSGSKTREKEKDKEKEKENEKVMERDQEAEITFDFNKFLEQMRLRSADPVAKYLRSFLKEFARRPPVSTADQIRVINDFLDFIAGKMRSVEPWKGVLADPNFERAEAEFDMAMEAMEKLVMNRVWHLTFTPAIDLNTIPGHVSPTDDLERDHVLNQRIRLFSWIQPCHLDLPVPTPSSTPETSQPMTLSTSTDSPTIEVPTNGSDTSPRTTPTPTSPEAQKHRQTQGFLDFARRELVKINQYKAPRDKLICVLNSCKVIFGLIRHLSSDEGADAFIPFLIYIVLKANPEHLVSNIHYIQRFRNPEKLSGEGGYYLSSLNGAISFIETMDASSLSNITQAEFEDNVERAILSLPMDPADSTMRIPTGPISRSTTPAELAHSTTADLTSATDVESPHDLGQSNLSFPDATKAFFMRSTDSVEKIVSKPLEAIGRIFETFDQEIASVTSSHLPSSISLDHPSTNPYSPAPRLRRSQSRTSTRSNHSISPSIKSNQHEAPEMILEEVSEIDRQHEEQRMASIETLQSVFPNLEREVLEMVLLSNGGEMAPTIDSLLEMS